MRVLIISAFLACAAAAPSGIVAPLVYQAVVPALPAVPAPTISPGDIQAAAINEQVKLNDLARAAADKAQEAADLAVENANLAADNANLAADNANVAVETANAKVATDVSQAQEKSLEAFWANEDKKWQALDALKTAEAQIDGAAASNAEANAKAAIGAVPYVAAIAPVTSYVASAPVVAAPAPVVAAPIPPVVYTPYTLKVDFKTVSTEVKTEEKKEDQEAVAVKSVEEVKPAESDDSVKVEAPAEKSGEEKKVAGVTTNVITPFASVYRYDLTLPVGQVIPQPVISYAAPLPQFPGVYTPTLVKSW